MFLARIRKRPTTPGLLVLLLCVWVMCTLLITTEREIDANYRLFTTLDDVPTTLDSSTTHRPRKVGCQDTMSHDNNKATDPPHLQLHVDRTDKSSAFIVWCHEKETFSFRHYLSLRSLLHVVRPDEIRFMYDTFPATDDSGYHQWLRKLGEEYPFLKFVQNKRSCRRGVPNEEWIYESLVLKNGGIYLNPNVILKESFYELIRDSSIGAVKLLDLNNKTIAFSMKRSFAMKNFKKVKTGISYFVNKSAIEEIKLLRDCETVAITSTLNPNDTLTKENSHCVVSDSWTDQIYPSDISACGSQICRYLQKLTYGYEHSNCVTDETPKNSIPAPNTVHFIRFGKFKMSFMFYLSILSFIHIQNVERVYIHCDHDPHGVHWTNLVKEQPGKIHLVYRSNAATVYNQTIKVVEHMADIAKADIAYKYGGILSDPDVIIVQKLKPDWFTQDAVVGYDIGSRYPFPDILNIGIFISKPRSEFTRQWQESMKSFNDSDWLWNSGKMTYKLVENDPRLAVIDSHLQVICFNFKCYPTWLPKDVYQNLDTSKDTLTHSLRNWATQAHSFHFTFPEPFVSEDYLSKQAGIAGDVGRHVYKAAGLMHRLKR